MRRRDFIIYSFAGLLGSGVVLVDNALAGQPKIYSNSATGIAINGYDPVSYFTDHKPVEGKSEFSAMWQGAKWYFSSSDNRAIFLAMPDKYAPQYGGYCAFAVSYGSTATTVPEAWSIVGGKLYLNNSLGVRSRWNEDQSDRILRADRNWPDVLK